MEEFPYNDAAARVEALNADITSQNERFVLTSSISDEDFKGLATASLTEEQQRSFDARNEAGKEIDYTEVLASWSELIDEGERLREKSTAIEQAIADIETQATLSARIAPAIAEQARNLADSKIEGQRAALADIQTELDSLQTRELGYVSVAQPWTIPRLEMATASPEVSVAPVVSVATEAESLVTEATPASSSEKLDETELKRVLWAVFDHAREAGATGVRIEEMRKTVPELAALSQEHYTYFKHNFGSMRKRIVEMLCDMGYGVEWTVSGQTRGTRYHVQEKQVRPQTRADRVFTSRPAAEPIAEPIPEATDTTPADTPDAPTNTQGQQPESTHLVPEAPRSAAPDILGQTAVEAATEPVAASEQQKSGKTVKFIKNASGSAGLIGQCNLVDVPVEDVARQLGIKRNPQYAREVEKWIEWLESNPQSPASKRVRAYKGLRLGRHETQLPLYRFAPKDVVGLKVPRHFLRHRVVYTMVEGEPALIEVLDHDAFDRKYN